MVADLRIDYPHEFATALGLAPDLAADPLALLLHAWESRGADCLSLVEGDFALAIWDATRRQLLLARDALGQRPLHFRTLPDRLVFASTAASLARAEGAPEADLERIVSLLSFIPDFGSKTFLRHVERVIPGHVVSIDARGSIRQDAWWRPRLHQVPISIQNAVDRMRAEVDRAVTAALVSDGGVVAAQLSGGHDSSLIVATAARLIARDTRLLAITGDAAGAKSLTYDCFDDATVAAATAAALPRVEHVIVRAPVESPLSAVDRWAASDQPMLNPFNLAWLDLTFETARQAGAKVMLVGISGNVTVSTWGADRLSILLRTGRWATLLREMRAYRRHQQASWFGLLGMALGPWVPEPLWLWISRTRGRDASRFDDRAFLRRDADQVRNARKRARTAGLATANAPARLTGSEARLAEMKWSDLGVLNHFMRTRFGVEVRDPLAARRLVELSLQLGPEHFYRDGQGRRLSRALLKGQVPEEVTSENIRRGLQGADWLEGAELARAEMKLELEYVSADPHLSALFDVDRLRHCLEHWPKDGWSNGEQSERYRLLTAGFSAVRWIRFVRSRGHEVTE